MIIELANYDITKRDFIKKNFDIIDYAEIMLYKKYDSYIEYQYTERNKK